MQETSKSLLDAIRAGPEETRWNELFSLYAPFIRTIAVRMGVQGDDVNDVAQDVMLVASRRIMDFDRRRVGAFRTWLRAITTNCLREYWRKNKNTPEPGARVEQLMDSHSDLTRYWDEEHNRHLLQILMDRAKPEFQPQTWEAFCRLALNNESVDKVAEDLEITTNAAYVARSRVMNRLRQLGAGLIE